MTKPELLSVGEIFNKEDYYSIPLYQRNYAWGQAEVTQLIRDVWDYSNKKANYYIGTLVVHRRNSANPVTFATIDGQQRLTTLNILLSVLKNKFQYEIDCKNHETKLQFDSRALSSDTLCMLATMGDTAPGELYNVRMRQAYQDMHKELKELEKENHTTVDDFKNYLMKYVKILRVEVPEKTDLNHYFEIMNSRGEQLEKQEVLKAQLLSHLKGDENSTRAFATIWEACSVMERYAVLGFKEREVRDKLFLNENNRWEKIPKSFEEVKQALATQKRKVGLETDITLLALLDDQIIDVPVEESSYDEKKSAFNSIINFPNFLLHALKIHTTLNPVMVAVGEEEHNVPLDDKNLLLTFEKHLDYNKSDEGKAKFAKDFAYTLLKTRILFDNYIIKREYTQEGDKWSLQSVRLTDDRKSFYYTNTFVDNAKNRQLLMLTAMFHVSFPQLIYKHWLSGVLFFLCTKSDEFSPDKPETYITYLEKLSKAFYFDRFGNIVESYHNIIFKNNSTAINTYVVEDNLHQGTRVHNFIFNRLDYLIWKSISVNSNRDYEIDKIDKFEFTFRSSIEHYYPQHPKTGADLIKLNCDTAERQKLIHSFGNLCLISRSKNSELSNFSPKAKAEHYDGSSTIESLKQRLMMQQKDNWGEDAIKDHAQLMIKLLEEDTALKYSQLNNEYV